MAAISAGGAGAVLLDVADRSSGLLYKRLWKQPWLSYIKKKIRFTEDTGVDQLTIFTVFSVKKRGGKKSILACLFAVYRTGLLVRDQSGDRKFGFLGI